MNEFLASMIKVVDEMQELLMADIIFQHMVIIGPLIDFEPSKEPIHNILHKDALLLHVSCFCGHKIFCGSKDILS